MNLMIIVDSMEKEQTAVQWLIETITLGLSEKGMKTAFDKTLEMEEEQLEHAFFAGGRARHNFHKGITFQSVEEYIEATYKEK
jgi:hypothetical protein